MSARKRGAVAIAAVGVLFAVIFTIMSIHTDYDDDDIVPRGDPDTTSVPVYP